MYWLVYQYITVTLLPLKPCLFFNLSSLELTTYFQVFTVVTFALCQMKTRRYLLLRLLA